MTVLEVKNIQKRFGSTQVLKGINFSLEQGQVLVIIGSSGSGKTTLLRCLNFLEMPDSGKIWVNGQQLLSGNEDEIRRSRLHFGLVFQSFNLFPQYTVLENITLAPTLLKIGSAAEIRERANYLLQRVGLAHKADAYPYQLSGGQQQRVAIARALATDPEIIYFDEPTSALDPELIGEVLAVMRQLAREGMTMLVVTHELNFAKNVSTKTIFMEDGQIVEAAPSAEFFASPRQERTKAFLTHIMHEEETK